MEGYAIERGTGMVGNVEVFPYQFLSFLFELLIHNHFHLKLIFVAPQRTKLKSNARD